MSPEDGECMPDVGYLISYTVRVSFCFNLIVTMTSCPCGYDFIPLEMRKYLNKFEIFKSPLFRDFELLKEILEFLKRLDILK